MSKAKTAVGAIAKVYVDDVLVGLFDSVNWSVSVSAEPIFILGRYSSPEVVPTAYEAVSVDCSGFRIIGNGGHVLPKMPKLQDLLQLETVRISITDRRETDAAKAKILDVVGCVPVRYSTGSQAKATSKIQITYLGTKASDESGAQDESANAADLP